VNFAIKTGALRDFLDNSAVPYQTAKPGSEMKTVDIASAARTYTMLISCSARKSERKTMRVLKAAISGLGAKAICLSGLASLTESHRTRRQRT
jgi:hypothetical protein